MKYVTSIKFKLEKIKILKDDFQKKKWIKDELTLFFYIYILSNQLDINFRKTPMAGIIVLPWFISSTYFSTLSTYFYIFPRVVCTIIRNCHYFFNTQITGLNLLIYPQKMVIIK